MKNVLIVLSFLFLFASCDDGDIDIASFDFEGADVKTCQVGIPDNFYLFSTKDKRALILKLPESVFNNQLINPIQNITINASNQVIYREYVGDVADNNICGFPTNVSLGLVKEWNGVGGTIRIETSIAKTENTTDASSRYVNYNHRITFINPSFDNGAGGEQKMDFIEFGTYSKINENNLNDFTAVSPKRCGANIRYLFKSSARQSLELTVDNTIFNTSSLDMPKTRLIDGNANKFSFKNFNSNVGDAYFCTPIPAATPTIAETWNARNGNGLNGVIEVVSSSIPGTNPQQFRHQITLRNVTVENGNLFFSLGNAYDFGSIIQ